MIALPGFAGQTVGVLGLGRSGLATARALAAGGAEPRVWDDGAAARDAAAAEGLSLADLTRPREVSGLSALVVSPGVPHLFPAPHAAIEAAWAAGVPVDNEIGLFFSALAAGEADDLAEGPAPRVVAITGSNGKSTTTALIAHILRIAGREVQEGGNIGLPALALDPPQPGSTVVLELSSYQIELARALAPDIAVFLNLSPDHLDRHGGMGGYFAAKRRLFEQGAPERCVIGVDEVYGRYLAATAAAGTAIPVSVTRKLRDSAHAVFMAGDFLSEWREGRQIASVDLRSAPALTGRHNHQNACAAWAAVRALGLGPRRIEAGLFSFPGLAHRMERLGRAREVLWVNDSKATNAEAAARALVCHDRVRWLAGGRPKEDGIADLAPYFGRVAKAYFFGEAAPVFAAQATGLPHGIYDDLAAATAAAAAEAEPGDTVLLSPAAASFDQFRDFEARGEAFRALAAPYLEGGS